MLSNFCKLALGTIIVSQLFFSEPTLAKELDSVPSNLPFVSELGNDLSLVQLPIEDIGIEELGYYSADCTEADGYPQLTSILVGKDEKFGDLPYGFSPNRYLSREFYSVSPARVMRVLFATGSYTHFYNPNAQINPFHRTVLRSPPVLQGRRVEGTTISTSYSMQLEAGYAVHSELSTFMDNNGIRRFRVDINSENGTIICISKNLRYQYYEGEYEKKLAVPDSVLVDRYNLKATPYPVGDARLGIDVSGNAVAIISNTAYVKCAVDVLNQQECDYAASSFHTSSVSTYTPPKKTSLKEYRANLVALGEDGKFYYLRGTAYTSGYALRVEPRNSSTLFEILENMRGFTVKTYIPFETVLRGSSAVCFISVEDEVFCTGGLVATNLVGTTYGPEDVQVKSLGRIPEASTLEISELNGHYPRRFMLKVLDQKENSLKTFEIESL